MLDENSGLQGAFRNAAHDLEEAVAPFPELMLDYLMIRRYEKDYLLRGASKYIDSISVTISHMKPELAEIVADPEVRDTISRKLDIYQRDLMALTEQDALIVAENATMRDKVHEIEPLIEATLAELTEAVTVEKAIIDNQVTRAILVTALLLGSAIIALKQVGGEPELIRSIAGRVAEGDFSMESDDERNGRKKNTGIYKAIRDMVGVLTDRATSLDRFANGDLTEQIEPTNEKDMLGNSLKQASESLNELLSEVSSAVEQVTAGSSQVSQARQSLSQGAAEQASSLEEITSSLNEINSQSDRQSADARPGPGNGED